METELAIQEQQASAPLSAVLVTVRSNWAAEVSRAVDQAAVMQGANLETFRDVRAKMLYCLFKRISKNGTHFLDTEETIRRLRRIADRLIERQLRRLVKNHLPSGTWVLEDEETRQLLQEKRYPKGPIQLGIIIKAWSQLTFLEQRVLSLDHLRYKVDEIAAILDLTPNAVEFYRSQATRKIYEIYRRLC